MAERRAQPPRARAAVVQLPRVRRSGVSRLLPSRRSVAAGIVLLLAAVGTYVAARRTSVFMVSRIEVVGAPAPVRSQVDQALRPFLGRSLVGLDGAALTRRVEALPAVLSATYDRAFPHTLRVTVVPETVVAVLRRGSEAWLVSARGRVVAPVRPGTSTALPRIWVPTRTAVSPGSVLADGDGGAAARAVAFATRFPAGIGVVLTGKDDVVFRLRSGLELRLGAPTDLRLKLAVARRALALLPVGATYLDVSVPGRPVAGVATMGNPKVSTGG